MLTFPNIDPVIISIGPISIHWYALAYVGGVIFGYLRATALANKHKIGISKKQLEDFITYAIVGIIIGGRLGYVLVYEPAKYFANPMDILKTYEGGMSFHGGFLGLVIAGAIHCHKNKIDYLRFMDLMSMVAPIGIYLGRIANFINAELYGRTTDVSWSFIFPGSDGMPRHPSQLYEAALEGFVLFFIMNLNKSMLAKKGASSGLFLIFYSAFRIIIEFFREPDMQLGFFFSNFTMGQLLSLPTFALGVCLLCRSRTK